MKKIFTKNLFQVKKVGDTLYIDKRSDLNPIGSVVWWAGDAVPVGYLLCDGSTVSRTLYPDLFAIIGTKYGAGDGNLTFNLPNLMDKTVWGSDVAGTEKAAGLPNITGGIVPHGSGGGATNKATVIQAVSGAFSTPESNSSAYRSGGDNISGSQSVTTIDFDASHSNSIYGNSDTVQPPALTLIPCIKAFGYVASGAGSSGGSGSGPNPNPGQSQLISDFLPLSGGTMKGGIALAVSNFGNNKHDILIGAGSNYLDGGTIVLRQGGDGDPNHNNYNPGGVDIYANRKTDNQYPEGELSIRCDGHTISKNGFVLPGKTPGTVVTKTGIQLPDTSRHHSIYLDRNDREIAIIAGTPDKGDAQGNNNYCSALYLHGIEAPSVTCDDTTNSLTLVPRVNDETNASGFALFAGNGTQAYSLQGQANTGKLIWSGTFEATKVYNAVWNDYAEFYPRGEETEAGDFIALDLSSDEEVYVKATKETSKAVGIHSDSFGHLIGGEQAPGAKDYVKYNLPKFIPVGLVGRVYGKVIGSIKKGEFIVISDIPGVARAFDPKTDTALDVIGMACESSSETEIRRVKINLR